MMQFELHYGGKNYGMVNITTKMEKLQEAYRNYCEREFEEEIETGDLNEFPIFYGASYETEDLYAEISVSLYAELNGDCEYTCFVDGKERYTECVSYKQAIEELNTCSFDDYYSYFADRCFEK